MSAAEELARLNEEFFDCMHTLDPLSATQLGVSGYDHLLPDPSRAASERGAARVAGLESEVAAIDESGLAPADAVNRSVLGHLTWALRTNLEDSIWARDASAAAYASPQAMAFLATPTAPLDGPPAVHDYLLRLEGLPHFFDAILDRYRESTAAGDRSTAVGVRQAIAQLEGHLSRPVGQDALMLPLSRARAAGTSDRRRGEELIEGAIRPAMVRLRAGLSDELLPTARPDTEVGMCWLGGGEATYLRAVRRHTTTTLTPEEIHAVGREVLEGLEEEWATIGARVFGKRIAPDDLRRRLREDPGLRFGSEAEIVKVVQDALNRAEAARDSWFPHYDIADCVIEEIDPVEAGNAALAYYRGPSDGGRRPGAHCVLTSDPGSRFVYEYEALAFHESSPGHHLQIASAQTLSHLPRYRKYLDAEVCAYVEGWGLYSERLADEMGLYTSDLQRLGMLSFDALRASRLVVDTGMHHLGWSRQQAMDFMWENTATTRSNVRNEIDRYIAWPGQALAYMTGRREIRRLREAAQRRLGSRFDIRGFHGAVLSEGAVPLPVLAQVVARWEAAAAEGDAAPPA